jgi:hypothetical protein
MPGPGEGPLQSFRAEWACLLTVDLATLGVAPAPGYYMTGFLTRAGANNDKILVKQP